MLKVFVPADVVSMVNMVLGAGAIVFVFLDMLQVAFSLLFLAVLADGLDGMMARRFTHGAAGEFLDSMGDLVSFVLAPLVFVFASYRIWFDDNISMVVFLCVFLVYLLCGVIRLASFHVVKQPGCFVGLPVPAAALCLLLLVMLDSNVWVVVGVVFVLAVAFLVPVRFPKPGGLISFFATIFIFSSILFGSFVEPYLYLVFLGAILVYIVGGPIFLLLKKNGAGGRGSSVE